MRRAMRDGMTPFRCKGGHILGMTRRDEDGMAQLVLFRRALYADMAPLLKNGSSTEEMEDMDVMGIVDGLSEFRCSICGRIRTWMPGPETLQRLIEKMQRRESE